MVNGVVIVDKPSDWTSFDVIAKLRGIYGTKKVGHSGTLDPMATGVLPIFFGNTTKFISYLPLKDKGYIADITFGIQTDTGDITGEVIKSCESIPTKEKLCIAMESFIGEITQTPPMYSAVKINGTPLYKLARAGKEAEVPPRRVTIYSLKLLGYSNNVATVEVSCSEGSYIRTLAEDIAKRCNSLATLSNLRRIQSGSCFINDAVTLEQIASHSDPKQLFMSIESFFTTLPSLTLESYRVQRIKNGLTQKVADIHGMARLYDGEDFAGLVEGDGETIKAVRMCQY